MTVEKASMLESTRSKTCKKAVGDKIGGTILKKK